MSTKILLLSALVALSSVIEAHVVKSLPLDVILKSGNSLYRKRRDAESSVADWNKDKVENLSEFLEDMSDAETNLTVIGWQRILDEEGNIKGINTIQLVIPPKPVTEVDVNVASDDDYDDSTSQDQIQKLRGILVPLFDLGLPSSVTYEEFNKKGERQSLFYLDEDELFVKEDNFATYNKTQTVSKNEVEEFIKNLKPTVFGKPTILYFNVDGNLDMEKSFIQPQFLGSVYDEHEAPVNIFLESPGIMAKISQQYPQEEHPKQLALHFNKAYPEYEWRTLVNPGHHFMTRDVEINLQYDNLDFDESSTIEYLVYGVKK